MTGRAAVNALQQRLDATFLRASGIAGDAELLSDFARYLCVLVSGFLEQSVIELLLEHTRRNANPSVQRYVEARVRRSTNLNAQRLEELLGGFDPIWAKDVRSFVVDEYKDAVDSIVSLRNVISHGRPVGVTMTRVTDYYTRICSVVEHVANICAI